MTMGTAGPHRVRAAIATTLLAIGLLGITARSEPAGAAGVPSAPLMGAVTVGHTSKAEIEWKQPVSDGGSEILYYVIRENPGAEGVNISSVADYGDHVAAEVYVDYGVTYRFSVAAVNELGQGPYSELAAPVTPVPLVSITTTNTTEGNSGTHLANYKVAFDFRSTAAVTIDYATGPTGAGTSFVPTSGTLTFTPGQETKTISVPIIGDTRYERNEKAVVRLSNPHGADFRKWTATSAILNDDPAPTLRIANASKREGAPGQRAGVKVPVALSAATGAVTKVHWAASNGTATGGDDYAAASGTLTIGKGKTTGRIVIPILGDGKVEPNETILVDLDSPVGATIADGHAVVTIVNDD
jgi:Calx-beta domain/Fibronectin type III domain